MAESGLNSRFSDMYKAFQYVDLDRSGRLSKKELRRALGAAASPQIPIVRCLTQVPNGAPRPAAHAEDVPRHNPK